MQEALVAAATTWPADGRPDNPLAWLIRVASRRMIDAVPHATTPAGAARISPRRGRSHRPATALAAGRHA